MRSNVPRKEIRGSESGADFTLRLKWNADSVFTADKKGS